MELRESIDRRRSIRKFKDTPAERKLIDQLISAVSVGYPDETPAERPRKKFEDIVEYRE